MKFVNFLRGSKMEDIQDTNVKTTIRKKDGTYAEVGLKTANFNSIEDILNVPGCVCNLMPAAKWDEQRNEMVYPIEFTLDKPHPQAFYSCTAEEWKTSATIKEEMLKAQQMLLEEYTRKKEENRILEELGVKEDLGRLE